MLSVSTGKKNLINQFFFICVCVCVYLYIDFHVNQGIYVVNQEIPYNIEHRLMDWKELRDGSLRIEQHFITTKMSQRKILVGKKGSKIG